MTPEQINCHGCGKPTSIALIDGKDDGTGNFEILHCRECYGPGWQPSSMSDLDEEDEDDEIVNHYCCEECDYEWEDTWSCAADDDCPNCGARHMTPYYSGDEEDERLARLKALREERT